jgi:dienelactone hydrolase
VRVRTPAHARGPAARLPPLEKDDTLQIHDRIRPLLWALLLAVAVAGCASSRTDRAGAYEPGAGPYAVRDIASLVLRDAVRGKDLEVRIRYPDAPGPFPIIVWSHGALGSKDGYAVLTDHWASHGYVVIQPTHADSRQLGGTLRDMRVLRGWQARPGDISFVLDSLAVLPEHAPALAGKLDASRVGVGGHSFGAHTAQLIGGVVAVTRAGERSFADERVAAVMVLSGQGPGEMLTERSWRNVTRPMLVMSGSRDATRTGAPPEWRRKPYELSPPGDKHLVWVEGLDHGYGGISGAGGLRARGLRARGLRARGLQNARNDDHVRYTQIVTLTYWDAYLERSDEARAYLMSRELVSLSRGAVELQHK